MIRRTLVVLIAVGLTACDLLGGINPDQVELLGLIRRVELDPGVDALDMNGATIIGLDWQHIHFHFTEPISADAVASFDPALHLSLPPGISLDPGAPPRFNESLLGLVPPRTILTVTLLPMDEGTYEISLKSPTSSPLEGESGETITGSFPFQVTVVAPDGKNPYIVQLRPQQNPGISDEIALSNWTGSIDHGATVAPHERLVVHFSERVRTPVPVDITPRGFGSVDGFPVLAPFGVSFVPRTTFFRWFDSVEEDVGRFVTVLESETPEGMELDSDYSFTFFGGSPSTSYQSRVVDRSGEPLRLRFNNKEHRELPLADVRVFRTAPIRWTTPAHRSLIPSSVFMGGIASLSIGGEIADSVLGVQWTVTPPGGTPSSAQATTRTVVTEENRTGVPIDRFSATWNLPVSAPDGDYVLAADARGLAFLGSDSIVVTKDTVGPVVSSGGSVEILATQQTIPGFCVRTAHLDAVKAEVIIAGGAYATSESPASIVNRAGIPVALEFCFEAFPLPSGAGLHAGLNSWAIRLTDAAGNAVDNVTTLVIKPVLFSVSPSVANEGDVITITGKGIDAVTVDGAISFGSGFIPLSHLTTAYIDTAASILFVDVTGTPDLADDDVVRVNVPGFVASGRLSLRLPDMTASTTVGLAVCLPEPLGSFVNDSLAFGGETALLPPANRGSDEVFPFLADVALTGNLVGPNASNLVPSVQFEAAHLPGIEPANQRFQPSLIPAPTADPAPTSTPFDVTTAGMPVVFAQTEFGGFGDLYAYEQRPNGGYVQELVNVDELGVDSRVTAVAAGQGPLNDARVAYAKKPLDLDQLWILLARKKFVNDSELSWESCFAAFHHGPVDTSLGTVLSLSFSPDGRAGIAYSAPSSGGALGLWSVIERTPDSCDFYEPALIDAGPGAAGAVSAAFDQHGDLWVAHNLDPRQNKSEVTSAPSEALTIRVHRIRTLPLGLVVDEMASPGGGIWPSIAFDPFSGTRAITFVEASLSLHRIDPPGFPTHWVGEVTIGDALYSEWLGSAGWAEPETVETRENIDLDVSTLHEALGLGGAAFENWNHALPRHVLRFTPSGGARVAFAHLDGRVSLATRLETAPFGTLWFHDSLEVTPEPGLSTVALAIDGAGNSRVLYHDGKIQALRMYQEETRRGLRLESPAPVCSSNRYDQQTFPLHSHRVQAALAPHRNFVLSAGTFQNPDAFEDPALIYDFLATALTRSAKTRLATTGETRSIEWVPLDVPDSNVTSLGDDFDPNEVFIDRIRYERRETPDADLNVAYLRVSPSRLLVNGSPIEEIPPELEVQISANNNDDISVVQCFACPASDPNCCPSPDVCDSDAMEDVGCLFNTTALESLGIEVRDTLAAALPLIPAGIKLGSGDVQGDIKRMSLEFKSANMTGLELVAFGDGKTSGSLRMSLILDAFHVKVHIDKAVVEVKDPLTGIEARQDLVGLCGGTFNVLGDVGSGNARIRIEEAPVFVSRDGSGRYGQPALAAPETTGRVDAGDINLRYTDINDVCEDTVESAEGKIKEKIAKKLRDPSGDLRRGLNEAGNGIHRAFLSPLLGDLLKKDSIDASSGVVLLVDPDGDLTAVFEKPLP